MTYVLGSPEDYVTTAMAPSRYSPESMVNHTDVWFDFTGSSRSEGIRGRLVRDSHETSQRIMLVDTRKSMTDFTRCRKVKHTTKIWRAFSLSALLTVR